MKSAYLNELLNSGVTLNEKETKIVEDYILSQSKYYYPKNYTGYRPK
jgi:hypothetical protein